MARDGEKGAIRLTLHAELLFDLRRLVKGLLVAVVPDRDVRARLGVGVGDSQPDTSASCALQRLISIHPPIW